MRLLAKCLSAQSAQRMFKVRYAETKSVHVGQHGKILAFRFSLSQSLQDAGVFVKLFCCTWQAAVLAPHAC
jgi:hypothetical protein